MIKFLKNILQFSNERENSDTEGKEVGRINNTGTVLGDFEICIPQGTHLPSGHVRLPHRAYYTIRLTSRLSRRTDAILRIDGKEVGTWRVQSNSSIELERPVNDTGRFTFYRLGSTGASAIGLEGTDDLGLVSATFIPEVALEPRVMFSNRVVDKRGGTGLSGASGQRFVGVESIQRDMAIAKTIIIRLIANDTRARPLIPISSKVPSPLP